MRDSHRFTITAIVFLAVLITVVSTGFFLRNYRYAASMPDQIAREVFDGKEAIATYEWFKEQEAYIRQCHKDEEITREQYEVYAEKLPEDMTQWTDFMSKEEASLRAAYNAHQKLTNKAIEDYNAKSSMVHKDIFKDLPTNVIRSAEDAFKLTFTY